MESKVFEVRDSGTTMPVLAVKLDSADLVERWLLERAGYALDQAARGNPPYILFAPIEPGSGSYGHFECDPYEWVRSRTLSNAHKHALDHWDELRSGAVIDVEYLLGKRSTPKVSERLSRAGGADAR